MKYLASLSLVALLSGCSSLSSLDAPTACSHDSFYSYTERAKALSRVSDKIALDLRDYEAFSRNHDRYTVAFDLSGTENADGMVLAKMLVFSGRYKVSLPCSSPSGQPDFLITGSVVPGQGVPKYQLSLNRSGKVLRSYSN